MEKIYVISGLGADERVFRGIDFSGWDAVFLKWLVPANGESISSYARRLAEGIQEPQPLIVGISFGGMIAVEIAKQIEVKKLILIASAKTRSEIPFCYRWAGKLRLHRLLPAHLLKQPNVLTDWFFGVKTAEERSRLAAILHDTDARFLKWAIAQIVSWRNEFRPQNLTHLHGTADRILPIRFVHCDQAIRDGAHFMTNDKVAEFSAQFRAALVR